MSARLYKGRVRRGKLIPGRARTRGGIGRAIREHLRDFLAIVALGALGLAATLVILLEQKAAFPEWLPLLGGDRFELRAELGSAQAVTPGQGQPVNLSGVRVGDITAVELDQGRAVVTMEVENRYAPLIHEDATLLLRPRTGLNDMTMEVDPGRRGSLEEGGTIPVSQSLPNVQSDQILASLDADTRAYLRLLLTAGAEGLGGGGEELSAGLRRLEPTARDLARINRALARRRTNLRRVIHDFGLLSEELGRKDTQLAEFVESSNAVLGSFASQEESLRASLRELPPTLRQTRSALAGADRLALTGTPAFRRLIPSAAALAPALRQTRPFLRRTTEPIREQIRPFTREVRRPVRHLKGAAENLGGAAPALASGFEDLNALLNMLAFNPAGTEEGFLFWASWLSHNGNLLFSTQDANGPLRRGMVLLSCSTAQLAESVASTRPALLTLQQATRIPTTTEICPLDPLPFPTRR